MSSPITAPSSRSPDSSDSLAARIARFPTRIVAAGPHRIGVREAGTGTPVLLLHGIGSSSASWLYQFEQFQFGPIGRSGQSGQFAGQARLIAWDQPGYGESALLAGEQPDADAYAGAALALADALHLDRFVLVGQSLGAIIATTLAVHASQRIDALVLLAPARGYGKASPEERHAKLKARLDAFEATDAAAYAQARAGNLLRPASSPEALELVRSGMAQLNVPGHRHAAYLLAHSDLATTAAQYEAPVLVASGADDRVTPPDGCRAIAAAFPQGRYQSLGAVGHAAYADDPAVVNHLFQEAFRHAHE